MRHVRLAAQGIDYEGVDTAYFVKRRPWHLRTVGDIGEIAYAESYDGQTGVHHRQRRYGGAVDDEIVIVINHMNAKALRHTLAEITGDILAAVDAEWLWMTIWTHVVDAANVVVVGMCYQQGRKSGGAGPQHLLTEIGTAVDKQVSAWSYLDHRRCPQPFFAWVGRSADLAAASYLRYACRCAGAEKCQFHQMR